MLFIHADLNANGAEDPGEIILFSEEDEYEAPEYHHYVYYHAGFFIAFFTLVDDGPSLMPDGSPGNRISQDDFTIYVLAIPPSGPLLEAEIEVTAVNVPPVFVQRPQLTFTTNDDGSRLASIANVHYFDPGIRDVITQSVIWGDGVETLVNGNGRLQRTYAASPGLSATAVYPVTVQLTDDDMGLGKYRIERVSVGLNDDDDNGNGNEDRYDETGTIAENDLVELDLSQIISNRPNPGGRIFIEYTEGPIRIWGNSTKSASIGRNDYVTSWEISEGLTNIWVEGIQFGEANLSIWWEPDESHNGNYQPPYMATRIPLGLVLAPVRSNMRIKSLLFDDLGILPDPSNQTLISPTEAKNRTRYGMPHHWLDNNLNGDIEPLQEDLKLPVAYVRNSTPAVTALFSLVEVSNARPSQIEIRGTGTGGTLFPAMMVARDNNGTYRYHSAATSSLPNVVKHYNDFEIDWQTRTPGGDWESAGITKNDLYLLLDSPQAPLFHTAVHYGSHYGAGSTSADQMIAAVWEYFAALNVMKQNEITHIGAVEINDVGKPLTYWSNYANSGGKNTEQLLHDMRGNCGAFADIFVASMQVQGVDQTNEFVQVTTSIFVNNWKPNGPQVEGHDVIIFRPYESGLEFFDPEAFFANKYGNNLDSYLLNQHSQLARMKGIPGQNEENPRADFGGDAGHAFVRYFVNGEMRWFDPSYGKEYFGSTDEKRIIDFEDKAVYGIAGDNIVDLELKMNRDLDEDGSITTEEDQTFDYQYYTVKRQRPGLKDVDYFFKEWGT